MLQSHQVEQLICLVSSLDRDALRNQFQNYPSGFPIDFSEEFLACQPLERLKHIFVALCLQNQRMPPSVPATSVAA
ncbi:MAG: hypothetical protein WBD40_16505 [Tepidisphaeraceae bacterium]